MTESICRLPVSFFVSIIQPWNFRSGGHLMKARGTILVVDERMQGLDAIRSEAKRGERSSGATIAALQALAVLTEAVASRQNVPQLVNWSRFFFDVFRCDPDRVGPNGHGCGNITASSRRTAAGGIAGEPSSGLSCPQRKPDVRRSSAAKLDGNVGCTGEVVGPVSVNTIAPFPFSGRRLRDRVGWVVLAGHITLSRHRRCFNTPLSLQRLDDDEIGSAI